MVASPSPPQLTASAFTTSPSTVVTAQVSPLRSDTDPRRRLFSPMNWATNAFSGRS